MRQQHQQKIDSIRSFACRLGRQIEASAEGTERIQLENRLREVKQDLSSAANTAAVETERTRCLELFALCKNSADPRADDAGGGMFQAFLRDGSHVKEAAGMLRAAAAMAGHDFEMIKEGQE